MGMNYVGYCKGCGALCAASAEIEGRQARLAEDVKRFIEDELRVERVDDEVVKTQFRRCTCASQNETTVAFCQECYAIVIAKANRAGYWVCPECGATG